VVGAFPDGQSALNLAAARLRHVAGTAWSSKRYLNVWLLKDQQMRGFLSSSLTCPASQSRFYVPRQFARAFGNDQFQGLEPYPSIAALVQFSVVKPCAPSGVR
jgi:hypothetical protein